MKLEDLTGKVAVITGASSGIGEAAARLLAEEGVRLVLVARRKDRIEALAKEVGGLAVAADVGKSAEVAALFATVKERFGGLDLLFNNAGMGIHTSFADSTEEQWRTQIDVNLYGVLSCTHAAIPLLRGRPGAMIASVTSTAGRWGSAGFSVYSAAKHAVVGFHDALRKELGPEGIRVTIVAPGSTRTEFGEGLSAEYWRERHESLEALRGEDVARLLVYAFAQPANVLIQDVGIRPTKQIAP